VFFHLVVGNWNGGGPLTQYDSQILSLLGWRKKRQIVHFKMVDDNQEKNK